MPKLLFIWFFFIFNSNLFSFDFNDFLNSVSDYDDLNAKTSDYIKIDDVIKSDNKGINTEKDYNDYDDWDYAPDKWNSFVNRLENGEINFNDKESVSVSTVTLSTAPVSLPPQVEFLDSGTSLNVTGRKVIGINYSGKKYINPQTNVTREKSTSLFDITQELQIRMQGKVGDKINVNVDYDDTKSDKQDISITYQGDPQEVVQNISFGDIDLSLPATEFVSYNKQLFGIRADIKTGGFKSTFIGSRTKGETKTKQFIGNTQFQSTNLSDTSYIRRKYYDITFGDITRLPIKAGSEKIYIDQQTNQVVDNIIISSITAYDLVSGASYSGRFKLLTRGIDYTIDYNKGLVTLAQTLNSVDVLIVDYQNYSGSWLHDEGTFGYKLLKTYNDIYITGSGEKGWNNEVKTYYYIGQTNIVRDDGHGNFTLKVQNLNKQDIGASLNPPQKYPDNIEVDFEQGIVHLLSPFGSEADPAIPDPLTYSQSPVSNRIIHIEYYYKLKTFMIESGIVLNSEIIKVDGVKLTKNVDYYIDYDSGFITFYNTDKIGQTSVIDMVYEVSPFGNSSQTLAGGRVSYDISNSVSLGATAIYQGSSKSKSAPMITDLASSLLVYDGDMQIKNLNIFGMRTSLSGEMAQSKLNPNINDYAIIDNMEGVKQEDSASMDKNYWYIASNPSNIPSHTDSINWDTEEINSRDINPNSPTDSKQSVLVINYDFSVSTEVSLTYVFSKTGLDFTQKNSFEMTVVGDNNTAGPDINLHFGDVNEDSDQSGGMTLVCSGGNILYGAPKTEDINCDNILSPSEDNGWEYYYNYSGSVSTRRFGSKNGIIDTQDLDGNGRMDAQNPWIGGDYGYLTNTKFIDITAGGSTYTNNINFSNWHNLVYPVVIASSDSYKWSNIKEVRISLKKSSLTPVRGRIKIARIAAVGNTWNVFLSTYTSENIKVLAVNNIDNTDYTPIYNVGGEISGIYEDLYGSVSSQKSDTGDKTISEQSISINFSSVTKDSRNYIYRKFSNSIDISQHKRLRFMVYNGKDNGSLRFYLKLGDENNYYKVSVPLDNTTIGWRVYNIDQNDENNDGVAETWAAGFPVKISTSGTVSLQQIPQIIAGVEVSDNDTNSYSGMIYLNEIHLSNPITRTGSARKVSGDFEIPGFMTFGGKHRYVDRAFMTPVSAVTNQDNEQNTGYLNLLKPAFFPTSYTYSRQNTNTPNVYLTGNNNLVNMLQNGKVKKQDITAQGLLSLWIFPKTNLNYTNNNVKYDLINREDNKNTYTASTNYQPPLNLFIIPKNINFSYTYIDNKVEYLPPYISTSDYYDTYEKTYSYSTRFDLEPVSFWKITPSYSLSKVNETRINLYDTSNPFGYPKSMQQSAGFDSSLKLFKWFNPSFNYSVTTNENNNLSITTVTLAQQSTTYNPGDIKTVNRNAQGSVNLSININDLLPKSKLLRSMIITSNYQLQDGDVWQNVEKDYNSKNKLWIRTPLKPKNPFAQRTSATIRDSYNSTLRWQPFESFVFNTRWKSLSTILITNNYNYSVQKNYTNDVYTETVNKTLPDLVFTVSQLEYLTGLKRWASDITMNIKYSYNTNEVIKTSLDKTNSFGTDLRFNLLNYINTYMTYNNKTTEKRDLTINQITGYTKNQTFSVQGTFDVKQYRFTPKLDYSNDYAETTLKTVTSNTTIITPSVLIKTDFRLPKKFKLPFLNEMMLDNRIIWTNSISYSIKKSPVSVSDNNRLFSINSTADIEPSQNLRISFNLLIQRYWSKYLKEDDYLSYQIGTNMILQF